MAAEHSVAGCISARYTLALIAFFGFLNVYALRVNLSIALVAMVNSTSVEDSAASNECAPINSSRGDLENLAETNCGEFNWDAQTQGLILGAFFCGYMVTQISAGRIAERFGAKIPMALGVLCTSVLTLFSPLAARTSVYLLIILRVFEGLAEGVIFPSMHVMLSNWAPVWERSRLVALTYSGAQMGTVVTMPLYELMCDSDFVGGWPSTFYVFGTTGCIWFIVWMCFVYDTPAKHPRISKEERHYIEQFIRKPPKKRKIPWLSVLKSAPVWAMLVLNFCANWGYYTLLTSMPIFIRHVLHFDIKKNGFVSGLPYLAMWVVYSLAGVISDFLRKNHYLTTTNTRKLMITLGSLGPAIFLVLTGYIGCNYTLAIVYLTASVGLKGFSSAGFLVNHLDLAPAYAGTLLGITNTIGTMPGIAGPYVVGIFTQNNQSLEQWSIVFGIAAGMYAFGAVVYVLLGSGETQSWAREKPYEHKPQYVYEEKEPEH